MPVETKNCQACKQSFPIEQDDLDFYEKMAVPAPTWCPPCRLARRLVWRNERNLSKRSCDLCKKDMLAVYGPDTAFPVYCPECWRGDGWDPLSYGRDYDFSKPFFEQFGELFKKVPRPALSHNGNNVNCEYANIIQDVKNVYFSFSILWGSEDIYYCNNVDRSRSIFDTYNASESEMVYGSIGSVKNYRSQACYWSSNCMDCMFMLDSTGCSNCVGCVGVKNRQYCVLNEQYTKEEYEKKLADLDLGSYKGRTVFEEQFEALARTIPRRYARITNGVDCTGDEILNSRNVRQAFNVWDAEDGKYLFRSPGCKQSMDASHLGHVEFAYEHAQGGSDPGQQLRFIIYGLPGQHDVSYGDYCGSAGNLFGCIGVRNKEYCVLNKQYTKDEYTELLPKVIEQTKTVPYTDASGRTYTYGEFFPPELSPFAYNESVMQEYIPLTQEKAAALGFAWKEKPKRSHQPTVQAADLPDHIKDVPDTITNEVIGCANGGEPEGCVGAFRIVPEELAFYRRMSIPLPHECQNCRYHARLAKRNPIKLWKRSCQCAGGTSEGGEHANTGNHVHGTEHCLNSFETPYAPDRPETVYCEQCYQAEVS